MGSKNYGEQGEAPLRRPQRDRGAVATEPKGPTGPPAGRSAQGPLQLLRPRGCSNIKLNCSNTIVNFKNFVSL